MDIYAVIAGELGVRRTQEAAAALLDEGNTVPFIARYRKEATGSLDDQVLRSCPTAWPICAGLRRAGRRFTGK